MSELREIIDHIKSEGHNIEDEVFICVFKHYIEGYFTILEHIKTKERKAVFLSNNDEKDAIDLGDMFDVIKNMKVDYDNLPD